MKLIFKLLIATVVIGLSLSFTVLKGDDGDSLLSVSNLKIPEFSLPDFSFTRLLGGKKPAKAKLPRDESTVYRWFDDEGNLQFSNSPPVEGTEYTLKRYNPNENVIPALNADSNDMEQ